jgi:hypothetical protein
VRKRRHSDGPPETLGDGQEALARLGHNEGGALELDGRGVGAAGKSRHEADERLARLVGEFSIEVD